jgi:hypothetical protein
MATMPTVESMIDTTAVDCVIRAVDIAGRHRFLEYECSLIKHAFQLICCKLPGNAALQEKLCDNAEFISTVVALVRLHLANDDVCRLGMTTMRYLCRNGTHKSTACNQGIAALGDEGVCDFFATALTIYVDQPSVLEEICHLGRNLSATVIKNAHRLSTPEVCSAVVGVLNRYGTTHVNLTEQATWILTNVAYFSKVARDAYYAAGAHTALTTILWAHRLTSADILKAACWAVYNLSQERGFRQEFVSVGVREYMMSLLEDQSLDEELRDHAEDALTRLPSDNTKPVGSQDSNSDSDSDSSDNSDDE